MVRPTNIDWFVENFEDMMNGIGYTKVANNKYITRYLNINEYVFVDAKNTYNFEAIWLSLEDNTDAQEYLDAFIDGSCYDVEDMAIEARNNDINDITERISNWNEFIGTMRNWW
ncbi:MAG: hypothetical protein LUC17_01330 [Oscillospiraceae bacterium]|nr:hypothetical protein [Oscillospiraceae bacterium]